MRVTEQCWWFHRNRETETVYAHKSSPKRNLLCGEHVSWLLIHAIPPKTAPSAATIITNCGKWTQPAGSWWPVYVCVGCRLLVTGAQGGLFCLDLVLSLFLFLSLSLSLFFYFVFNFLSLFFKQWTMNPYTLLSPGVCHMMGAPGMRPGWWFLVLCCKMMQNGSLRITFTSSVTMLCSSRSTRQLFRVRACVCVWPHFQLTCLTDLFPVSLTFCDYLHPYFVLSPYYVFSPFSFLNRNDIPRN